MASKRILIVSTAYLPLVGGAELAIKEITGRLSDWEFDLICARLNSNLKSRERIGRVNVQRFGIGATIDKYLLPLFVILRLARRRYDIVWTVMASYGAFAAALLRFFRPKTKIKHLLTLQEGDSEEHIVKRVGIFYPLWRLIFKNVDYVQTISVYLADFARRHGAKAQIDIVPNGVDLDRIMNHESRIMNKERFVIITTSRLVPKNGIDVLIRASKDLKTIIPDSKFIIQIIGSGPDDKKLKTLAKDLGVEDIVEFASHIPPEKIPDYLSRADIFVRPSRSEGLGSSFIEAMAAGLPIIGTEVGGIPDFLKDGETGLFAKVNDPQDLARKIKLLVENKDLREKIARQGRKLALSDYSWDSIASRMNNIFQKLS